MHKGVKCGVKLIGGMKMTLFGGKMVNWLHLGVFPISGSMNLWGNYAKNG